MHTYMYTYRSDDQTHSMVSIRGVRHTYIHTYIHTCRSDDQTDRMVSIRGDPVQIQKAKAMVEEIIRNHGGQ